MLEKYRVSPWPVLLSVPCLDQVEVADAEAVVLEGLVEHRAEALPHQAAPGVRRPDIVVGHRRSRCELHSGDLVEPGREFGGLCGTHAHDLVEGRIEREVKPVRSTVGL